MKRPDRPSADAPWNICARLERAFRAIDFTYFSTTGALSSCQTCDESIVWIIIVLRQPWGEYSRRSTKTGIKIRREKCSVQKSGAHSITCVHVANYKVKSEAIIINFFQFVAYYSSLCRKNKPPIKGVYSKRRVRLFATSTTDNCRRLYLILMPLLKFTFVLCVADG